MYIRSINGIRDVPSLWIHGTDTVDLNCRVKKTFAYQLDTMYSQSLKSGGNQRDPPVNKLEMLCFDEAESAVPAYQ
jgi:hypothetical protein